MADGKANQLLQTVSFAAEVQRQGKNAVQQVKYRVSHQPVMAVKPLHEHGKQLFPDLLGASLHSGYHDKF